MMGDDILGAAPYPGAESGAGSGTEGNGSGSCGSSFKLMPNPPLPKLGTRISLGSGTTGGLPA